VIFNLTRIKVNADKGLPSVNAGTPGYTKNARYLWGRSSRGGALAGLDQMDRVSTQSGYVDSSQPT
jgi:hypothetical protein